MSIRRDPIYISSDVWRWLRLLAKAEQREPDQMQRIATADEIADQILRQAIREQYPTLAEHEKQIDKLEKQLIESLKKNEDRTIPRSGSEGD